MSAKILSGKELSEQLTLEQAVKIQEFLAKGYRNPALAVILVGSDKASQIYVNHKQKRCEQIGITSKFYPFSENLREDELLALIDGLNKDQNIDGILVQLPLPTHIDSKKILESIDPAKDVDGFHPENVGKLSQGNGYLRSCTPFGVIELLRNANISLAGKDALVIGASNIVGKPMLMELLNQNATVTIAHKFTQNLPEKIKQADIIVVAIRSPKFIQADWIKDGAVVIDVGTNRDENNKLCGDVDFENAKEKASFITPVPGGVGPMTVTMLMHNTILSYEDRVLK